MTEFSFFGELPL